MLPNRRLLETQTSRFRLERTASGHSGTLIPRGMLAQDSAPPCDSVADTLPLPPASTTRTSWHDIRAGMAKSMILQKKIQAQMQERAKGIAMTPHTEQSEYTPSVDSTVSVPKLSCFTQHFLRCTLDPGYPPHPHLMDPPVPHSSLSALPAGIHLMHLWRSGGKSCQLNPWSFDHAIYSLCFIRIHFTLRPIM
jgi:hypothetical protein